MTKDILRDLMGFSGRVTRIYLSDFTDDELLIRPMPEMNHVAWQLGHLICSEHSMMTRIGCAMPELPAGFAEKYTDKTSRSDDPAQFTTKAEYLSLWDTMRTATLAALDSTPQSELAKPTPESMHRYATTVAALFRHVGAHELMHVGQYVAIRRKLGKPVLI